MENTENNVEVKKRHISNSDRFPRLFREVTRVLKRIKTERKDARTILYSSKLKGQNFKKVHALTFNILKNKKTINKIIEEIDLIHKEPHISLEHIEVMVHEIATQKRPLPGTSKPILAMQKYEDDIVRLSTKYQNLVNHDPHIIPRYARINTLVTNVFKVIEWLKKHEYNQISMNKEDTSFSEFVNIAKNLMPGEFVQDFNFPDVLVFSPNENLSQISIYNKGHIFLQDKASYIPVHVLNLPLDSKVLDCCAAPGMKTVHLAGALQNSGSIIALDHDSERFSILQRTLEHGNVTNCTAFCLDFTKVDPTLEPYSSVEYILLDPSCSGSGMTDRLSVDPNDEFSKCPERLQKLSGFQIILLKHALKFPNVKKIVYSTCSVHEQENEFVINESLQCHGETFRVSNILPEWKERGSDAYEFGPLCVRAYPDKNLTKGFFVALIERIEISNLNTEKTVPKTKKLDKNTKIVETSQNTDEYTLSPKGNKKFVKSERKKLKHGEMSLNGRFKDKIRNHIQNDCDVSKSVLEESNASVGYKKKKKKSKKHAHEVAEEQDIKSEKNFDIDTNSKEKVHCDASKGNDETSHKKRKHKHHRTETELTEFPVVIKCENEKDPDFLQDTVDMSVPILEDSSTSLEHKKKKKKSKKHTHELPEEEIQNESDEVPHKKKKHKRSKNETESTEFPSEIKSNNKNIKDEGILKKSDALLEYTKKKSKKRAHHILEKQDI